MLSPACISAFLRRFFPQILGITVFLWGSVALPAEAINYYVDNAPTHSGKDSNSGTSINSPFLTIQKAANVAVAGDTVFVRAGTYRETVTPLNSGSSVKPIIYTSYNGETVLLNGTDPVAGWSRDSGVIYKASLSGTFFSSTIHQSIQVFVDGQMVNLARWPNTSLDVSHPVKSTLTGFISKSTVGNRTTAVFQDSKLNVPDHTLDNAQIYMQPNNGGWSWVFTGTITSQVGQQLTIQSYNGSGKDGNQSVYAVGARYYLFNAKNLLDAPGEWWQDTTNGFLYLWTPGSDSPAGHTVEVKRRDYAFDLSNRSYITIKGLHLFACTITTDSAAGDGIGTEADGAPHYGWRAAGTLASSKNIVLDGLSCRYLSHFTDMSGHMAGQWGQNTGLIVSGTNQTVQNCVLQYSAGNGITSLGVGNVIFNNIIADVNYNCMDGGFIHSGFSGLRQNQQWSYNTGDRAGRQGLMIRGLQNSDTKKLVTSIHHNDIGQVMLQDWDGGCIYTAGDAGTFLRIDHNLFHNVPGQFNAGVYLDFCKDYVVDHNVCWDMDWAIFFQSNYGGTASGKSNILAYNNTVYALSHNIYGFGPFGFINNSVRPLSGTIITNNLYNEPVSGTSAATLTNNLQWDKVPGSATDPRYTNLATNDFTLLSGSPARNAGVLFPSVSKDGITVPGYNDAYTGAAPDLGAYMFGKPAFVAGANAMGTTPGVVTNVQAEGGNQRVFLRWNVTPNTTSYTIKRGTRSGGPYTIIAENVKETTYTDTNVSNGIVYYYVLVGVNSAGAGVETLQVMATAHASVIAVNCGGGAIGSFVADTYFTGGDTATSSWQIDRNYVREPAQENAYQTERWGACTYSIPGLNPGSPYVVRLHFAETFFKTTGQRLFNVRINNTPVLTDYDIIADTGAPATAISREFMARADTNGRIVVDFTAGSVDNPSIKGIEILVPPPFSVSPPVNLVGVPGTSKGSVILTWTQSTSPNIVTNKVYRARIDGGPLTLITTVSSVTRFTNSGLATGTAYYYVVTAVDSNGIESGKSNQGMAIAK